VQSSNAYANGSDPNCGNVITDRSTTRLHAPPGGHSQICFGADPRDAPQPVGRVSTQEHQDYRMNTVSNVTSQVFGVPSAAHAASSNAFANGSDQNNGNFITDRPTTRLHAPPGGHSQISFGTDNVFSAPVTSSRPNTAAAAAKEREQTGSDIFGAAPAPQQQQQQQEVVEEAPPPLHVAATEQTFKAMMIAELRTLCREHGISPAGSKTTLVERLCEAIASGEVAIMVANKGTSGVSKVGNNYGRAEGQNVGNFMTGRNSSRVLAPPGGGSTFSLGGYGSEAPPSPGNMVGRQMR
jgi:SPIRAL1-like protein